MGEMVWDGLGWVLGFGCMHQRWVSWYMQQGQGVSGLWWDSLDTDFYLYTFIVFASLRAQDWGRGSCDGMR